MTGQYFKLEHDQFRLHPSTKLLITAQLGCLNQVWPNLLKSWAAYDNSFKLEVLWMAQMFRFILSTHHNYIRKSG
jgi:hypothetical protein